MNSICMTMAASAAMLGLLSNAAIASDPWPGYTLISPMGSTTTSLIDNNGDTYHSWNTGYRPALSAYLLEDGSLMRTAQLTGPGQSFNGTGGAGGRVERYDWDGNLTWEYEYSGSGYRLHHDIEVLPSGNVLMIAWEQVSRAEAIAAGRDPNQLSDGELWPDHIIEVQPTGSSGGNIVWEWSAWDHLVQDYDVVQDNYGDVDGADFLMWQRGKSPDPLSTTDLANWQTYYGAASNYPVNLAVVPEPSTFVLLALGPASLIMLGCHRLRRAE